MVQSGIASLRKTMFLTTLILWSFVSGGSCHRALKFWVKFFVVFDSHFLHFLHIVEDLSALTDLANHVFPLLFLFIDASFKVCYQHLCFTLHLKFVLQFLVQNVLALLEFSTVWNQLIDLSLHVLSLSGNILCLQIFCL